MLKKITLALIVFTAATYSNGFPLVKPIKDGDPPVISDLKVDPQAGPVGTTYTITLHITDPQGPDDIVNTLYQVRERSEVIEVLINDEGVDGDISKGDGIHTGKSIVPRTAAKITHLFEVFVLDKEGHKSNVLEYHFTVLEGLENGVPPSSWTVYSLRIKQQRSIGLSSGF